MKITIFTLGRITPVPKCFVRYLCVITFYILIVNDFMLSPQEEEIRAHCGYSCATIRLTIPAAPLLSGQYIVVRGRNETSMSVPWPHFTLGLASHFHLDCY